MVVIEPAVLAVVKVQPLFKVNSTVPSIALVPATKDEPASTIIVAVVPVNEPPALE